MSNAESEEQHNSIYTIDSKEQMRKKDNAL